MPRITIFALALFLISGAPAVVAQEIRPGVWAGSEPQTLPLPTRGYQVYLVGELHGIEETQDFLVRYLALLHKISGLRDVALEEKGVYEDQAQAYVEGKSDTLPESLCLRADILGRIRLLNASLQKAERIRVHFSDLDSPAAAIRQHLIAIKKRIPKAANVSIPEAGEIKERGLETVTQLKNFHMDSRTRSELRTVKHSIHAYLQGFEVDIGQVQGSPYLEDREQAVASNIEDLLHTRGIRSLLVLYGSDHISKASRKDGGPNRDQRFSPMAMRLEHAGIRIFCMETFSLTGRSYWRGHGDQLPYTAKDGQLASGETLDEVLASAPHAQFFYVDTKRQHARLPTEDATRRAVDAFLLFPSGTPMKNRCPVY